MEKHIPLDNTIKELDDIMSRVNGLEVSSTDEYQKAMVSVLKTLVQGEINPNNYHSFHHSFHQSFHHEFPKFHN